MRLRFGHLLYFQLERPDDAERLLSQALELLEAGNPSPQSDAARLEVHSHLATVAYNRGRLAEAEERYGRLLDLLEVQVRDKPQDVAARYQLSSALFNLAQVHLALNKYREAEEEYLRVLNLQQSLIEASPRSSEYRKARGNTLMRLGTLLCLVGRIKDGEQRLLQARDVYAGLTADFPATMIFFIQLAATDHFLGWLYSANSRLQEAEPALERSLEAIGKVLAESPAFVKPRSDRANTTMLLGYVRMQAGKYPEALAAMTKARDLFRELAGEFPNSPNFQVQVSAAEHNIGDIYFNQRRSREAEQSYRKAEATLLAVPEAMRGLPSTRNDRANTNMRLSITLGRLGKIDEAEMRMKQARDLYGGLSAEFPTDPNHMFTHAGANHNLATILVRTGKPAEAEAAFRASLEINRRLLTQLPDRSQAKADLAGSCQSLAALLHTTGQDDEALDLLGESIDLWRGLTKQFPTVPRYQVGACYAKSSLALIEGRNSDAARFAEELAKVQGEPDSRFDAACLLALCADAEGTSTPEGKDFADRALRLLHEAEERGEIPFYELSDNSDLDSIRDRPEFKALLSRLEAKETLPPK